MRTYRNGGGNSGIAEYEYDDEKIRVKFDDNVVYEYRRDVIGDSNFAEMVRLADSGHGLNGFIMRNRSIKSRYSNKYRG